MLTLEKNIDFRKAELLLPTSKSLSNRALIIRELSPERFDIQDLSDSDDTRNLLQQLESDSPVLDIGAAGTNMRFLISLLSIQPGTKIITGSERMLKRPVKELADALSILGARIQYLRETGFPPLKITGGNLSGGNISVNGSISSQFISSLLMIGPVMGNGLVLEITGDIVSRPYIQMTLDMMGYFGIKYAWENNLIHIAPQKYSSRNYAVEGDWSAAGFFYGFVGCSAIGTSIHIKNLSLKSWQGDQETASYFKKLGVNTISHHSGITIQKENNPIENNLEFNLIEQPDLFPALAFTCATLRVQATFTGLQTLNLKESKRIETIAVEIKKTGAVSEITDESLRITAYKDPDEKVIFNTHHDHRIAMAAAIYSMSGKMIQINDEDVVSKSYPGYWKALKNIAIANIY